jgi:hypothetical protein
LSARIDFYRKNTFPFLGKYTIYPIYFGIGCRTYDAVYKPKPGRKLVGVETALKEAETNSKEKVEPAEASLQRDYYIEVKMI